jgi:TcpE family
VRDLPTYTSVFRLKRRLYAIYDWELPVPLGLLEVAVFAAGVAVFAGLAAAFGIELSPRTAWFFVVPPGFLAYLARQPIADGKQPHAWFLAQVKYVLEPRVLVNAAEARRRDARDIRERVQS